MLRGVAALVKSPDQSPGDEAHIPLSIGTKGNQEGGGGGGGAVRGGKKIKIVVPWVATHVRSPDQSPGCEAPIPWSSLNFLDLVSYRVVDRYFGRLSVDILAECWSTVKRVLIDYRSSIDQVRG